MEDIDLTMLARSAYRAILRSVETAEAEEPETVKEVVPMTAQRLSPGANASEPNRTQSQYNTNKEEIKA